MTDIKNMQNYTEVYTIKFGENPKPATIKFVIVNEIQWAKEQAIETPQPKPVLIKRNSALDINNRIVQPMVLSNESMPINHIVSYQNNGQHNNSQNGNPLNGNYQNNNTLNGNYQNNNTLNGNPLNGNSVNGNYPNNNTLNGNPLNGNYQNNNPQNGIYHDNNYVDNNYQNLRSLPPITRVSPASPTGRNSFVVSWKNLSYTINKSWPSKQRKKVILNDLYGHFRSGEVTALMGPSGAGKTTLLECICGLKQRGVTGEIRLRGVDTVSLGIVPQFDALLDCLSVKEMLTFASKLHEATVNTKVNHTNIIEKLIKQFKLETVADTRISRCSGGQKKRVSIAIEVIAKPNVLILDEPTTGLDSPSCNLFMDVMKKFSTESKRPIAILATIHQPSINVFNGFDHLYILSNDGQCIYEGSPKKLLDSLSKVGLNCQSYNSPSDFAIEVAAGDYGSYGINKLIYYQKSQNMSELVTMGTKLLRDSIKRAKHPLLTHTKILFHRAALTTYRNPFITIVRIIFVFFASICLSLMFGNKIGNASGCPPQEMELYTTDMLVLSTKFKDDLIRIMQNVALFFIGLMTGLIGSIGPVVLSFPNEMQTFIKEYRNDWYTIASFYFSRVFIDLPLQVITPTIYIVISYVMTGQPMVIDRPAGLIFMSVLMGLTGQSIGESASAIFCYSVTSAAFAGGMIPLPMILLGGFLVKVSRMPAYLQPLSWLSFLRFAFEGMLIVLYGFGRCQYENDKIASTVNITTLETPVWVKYLPMLFSAIEKAEGGKGLTKVDDEEYDYDSDVQEWSAKKSVEMLMKFFTRSMVKDGENVDFNKSLILLFYEITDHEFYRAIFVMVAYLIFFRIATYVILVIKLKLKR